MFSKALGGAPGPEDSRAGDSWATAPGRRDRFCETLPRVLAGHRARASRRLTKEDVKNCKWERALHHAQGRAS